MTVLPLINTFLTLLGILVLMPIAMFCTECLAAVLLSRRLGCMSLPCSGRACPPCIPDNAAGKPARYTTRRIALDATGDAERPRVAVLIPAHNEQLLIEQTVAAIPGNRSCPVGDWSIFRRENVFFERSQAENMDLSPSPARGGQSHFRGENVGCRSDVLRAAKIGTVPYESQVLVVADNCDDQTAELARRAGAEVVVRTDPEHRGKGYALEAGLQSLRHDPPDVVVVIDADCLTDPQAIDTLARVAWTTQRPVQALNLTDRNPAAGPLQAVALLGNRFINMIRPLGLLAIGAPCRLMGTGMAIPWRLADSVQLAGGSLVEDMQLGIDLALKGHLPLFCPDARVTSGLPPADRAFVSQRTRWDHGHLHTAIAQIPRLLAAAVRRRSWPLLAVALDLSIPPLTLLVALWLGAAILAGAAWRLGAAWLPIALLAGGGGALAAALGLGWAVFCRRQVPLRALAAVPLYMLRKLPIYARLIFHRQHAWVRTERDVNMHSPRPLAGEGQGVRATSR